MNSIIPYDDWEQQAQRIEERAKAIWEQRPQRRGFTVSPVVIFAHAAHGDAGNISLAGAAGLKTAAVRQAAPAAVVKIAKGNGTVLIGGHFTPEVRRTLLLVQAEPENAGKNLKRLLGEAISDLCAKYGKPRPYRGEG